MQYNFAPVDMQYYSLLERLEILPHLENFLASHEPKITQAFENMIAKMESEAKTQWHTRFIQDMDCKQFINMFEFTFCVIFAKDMARVSQKHDNKKLSSAAALSMAIKMANNPSNPTYVEQLDRVVSICCNSILSAYRARSK